MTCPRRSLRRPGLAPGTRNRAQLLSCILFDIALARMVLRRFNQASRAPGHESGPRRHQYHANGYVDRSRLSRDRRFASDLDCWSILDAGRLREGLTTPHTIRVTGSRCSTMDYAKYTRRADSLRWAQGYQQRALAVGNYRGVARAARVIEALAIWLNQNMPPPEVTSY